MINRKLELHQNKKKTQDKDNLIGKTNRGNDSDLEQNHEDIKEEIENENENILPIERFFAGKATLADLPLLEARGEYELLIVSLRKFIRADKRIFSDTWVQNWLGRRWRNFFISIAASQEPEAVRFSTEQPSGIMDRIMGLEDLRSPEQRIATRFLVLIDDSSNKLLFSPGTKKARKAAEAAISPGGFHSTTTSKNGFSILPFKGVGVDGVSYLTWPSLKKRKIEEDDKSSNSSNSSTEITSTTVEITSTMDDVKNIVKDVHIEKSYSHIEIAKNGDKKITKITTEHDSMEIEAGITTNNSNKRKRSSSYFDDEYIKDNAVSHLADKKFNKLEVETKNLKDDTGKDNLSIKTNSAASDSFMSTEKLESLWNFQSRSGIGLLSEWAYAVRDENSLWWRTSVEVRNGQRPLPLAQIPPKRKPLSKIVDGNTSKLNSLIEDNLTDLEENESDVVIEKFIDKSNASSVSEIDNLSNQDIDFASHALSFQPDNTVYSNSSSHSRDKSSKDKKPMTKTDNLNNKKETSLASVTIDNTSEDIRPPHSHMMFCPGLLNGMIPLRAFQTAFPRIENELDVRIRRVDAHPLRSAADNVADYDDFFNGIRQRNAIGKRMRWKDKYLDTVLQKDESPNNNSFLSAFSNFGHKMKESFEEIKTWKHFKSNSSSEVDLNGEGINNKRKFSFKKLTSLKLGFGKISEPSNDKTDDKNILSKDVNNDMEEDVNIDEDALKKRSFTNDIKDYLGDYLSLNKWSSSGKSTEDINESNMSSISASQRAAMLKNPSHSTIEYEMRDMIEHKSSKNLKEDNKQGKSKIRLVEITKMIIDKLSANDKSKKTQKEIINVNTNQDNNNDKAKNNINNIESDIIPDISVDEIDNIYPKMVDIFSRKNNDDSSTIVSNSIYMDHAGSNLSESETDYDDASSTDDSSREEGTLNDNYSLEYEEDKESSIKDSGIGEFSDSNIPKIVVIDNMSTQNHNNSSDNSLVERNSGNSKSKNKAKAKNQMRFIKHLKQAHRRKYVALTYSKGIVDILEYLLRRPERKKQINGIFCYAGAIYGSYVADEFFEVLSMLPQSYQELDPWLITRVLDMLWPLMDTRQLDVYSRVSQSRPIAALKDLTTYKRKEFMEKYEDEFQSKNGWDIPVFCISGATTPEECPYFQSSGFTKLSDYDVLNDMQLTTDQVIMKSDLSVHLAVVRAHHWDMAFTAFPQLFSGLSQKLKHPFPKYASASAMTLLAMELGLL